jgi:hypothetical protein
MVEAVRPAGRASERLDLWACPYCLSSLFADGAALRCTHCGREYPVAASGQPDFRPTTPCSTRIEYAYDPEWGRFPWDKARIGWPESTLPFEVPERWHNVERHMLGAIPPARAGARSLDLGCGVSHQRFIEPLTRLGYDHVGVDIDGAAPHALADIHLLPFRDASFDLIVTSGVFQALKNPLVATLEAARVAKEGALFVGLISFGEPFSISYFHHTPLGVFDLLEGCGFDSQAFFLDNDWHAFRAHLEMGFAGRRLPRVMQKAIAGGIYGTALLPAAAKSVLTGSRAPLQRARMNFARSHSGNVGFVATRRRRPNESRIIERFQDLAPMAAPVGTAT